MSFVPTQAHINNVSLVELNFSENLLQGLRQAVAFVTQRTDPPYIKGMTVSYSRLTDIFISFMEIHSLFLDKSSCATVGERYMGLKRVSKRRTGSLNRAQKIISLIETVVIPYIVSRDREKDRLFIQSYKVLKSLLGILYLLRLSQVSSPLQYLAGIEIVRHFESPQPSHPRAWKDYLKRLPSLFIWGLVYSIQFSQWYFSHQDVLRPKPNSVAVNPPPEKPSLLVDLRLCPICRQNRKNPTALLTDGTVFCYSCIANKLGPEKLPLLTRRIVE